MATDDRPPTTDHRQPTTDLITHRPAQLVLQLPLAVAGAAADAAAAARIFAKYRLEDIAEETRRRQDADLACFASYLQAAGIETGDLASEPAAWRGLTWGMVAGFVEWQLQQGYAIGSINIRLSTVKTYAKLATRAGQVAPEEYALIRLVSGFRQAQGRRIDAKRETKRKGAKKAEPVSICYDQAQRLKDQGDLLHRLLMALLLDHGLRVGEVVILEPRHFDLRRGLLRFYRPKVDRQQSHRLSSDARSAAEDYFASAPDLAPDQPFFPCDRTIRVWVGKFGEAIGLAGLSPHDARHYWATAAIAGGTDLKSLQDAGGWNSPAMPLRYAESAEIANEGVKLG